MSNRIAITLAIAFVIFLAQKGLLPSLIDVLFGASPAAPKVGGNGNATGPGSTGATDLPGKVKELSSGRGGFTNPLEFLSGPLKTLRSIRSLF